MPNSDFLLLFEKNYKINIAVAHWANSIIRFLSIQGIWICSFYLLTPYQSTKNSANTDKDDFGAAPEADSSHHPGYHEVSKDWSTENYCKEVKIIDKNTKQEVLKKKYDVHVKYHSRAEKAQTKVRSFDTEAEAKASLWIQNWSRNWNSSQEGSMAWAIGADKRWWRWRWEALLECR